MDEHEKATAASGQTDEESAWLALKDRALDAAAEGITIADARHPDRRLIYANQGFERMTGCDVLVAQDDAPGALLAFRKSLAIAEPLSARDPQNTKWQRGLMVSYARMALMTQPTNSAGGMIWWRKAFEQLDGMNRRGVMNPSDQGTLDFLRGKVGGK